VGETFGKILIAANIPGNSSKAKPRLHDFRHRFAVKSLASCPDSKDRITRHMLALSTYMGHTHVEDTYWYLESAAELMGDIADKCQAYLQAGV
jgi:integrase/recombinase XerD